MEEGLREKWDSLYSGQSRPWRGNSDLTWTGIPRGSKVLDAGCGNGKCTDSLLSMGCSVTGVDFSESAIRSCMSRFGEKAEFIACDVRSLPFANGTFDYVLSQHCIEHIPADSEYLALSEFERVLKPDGHLCLQVFATGDFRSEGKTEDVRNGILYRYHSEESLREALGDWRIISLERVSETTRFGERRERIRCVASLNQ